MLTIYTYPTIYLITIIVGLIFYKKYEHNVLLKYFLFFQIYSLITEIVGVFFLLVLNENNVYIYNTWIILSCLFYLIIFLKTIKSKKRKNIIKGLIAFFVIYTTINIIFFNNFIFQILIYNNILGKFLILITIVMYFSELMKSDDILNIKESLLFWISFGVFLYAIGFIPVYVIAQLIDFQGVFRYITFALNILMSLCFITGFILSKKEYNS